MTLKEELDKHYQDLLKEIIKEEKQHKMKMQKDIKRALFRSKIKKILSGIMIR